MKTTDEVKKKIERFWENEERTDVFVNDKDDSGYYETNKTPSEKVETLPHFMKRVTDETDGVIAQAQLEADRSAAEANRSRDERVESQKAALTSVGAADRSADEADRARGEADRARGEADRSKDEADRSETAGQVAAENARGEVERIIEGLLEEGGGMVPSSRIISTTFPLTGGGDLSSDLNKIL